MGCKSSKGFNRAQRIAWAKREVKRQMIEKGVVFADNSPKSQWHWSMAGDDGRVHTGIVLANTKGEAKSHLKASLHLPKSRRFPDSIEIKKVREYAATSILNGPVEASPVPTGGDSDDLRASVPAIESGDSGSV